jgi:hypothetical protein
MSYHTDELIAEKGKHRLYPALLTICFTVASITIALAIQAGRNINRWPPGASINIATNQFDFGIHMPLVGPVESLLERTTPQKITLLISPKSTHDSGFDGVNVQEPLVKVIVPFFVEFYEDSKPFIEGKFTKNFKLWPPLWQFAGVVRNAASHNAVGFSDQKLKPVTWYSLTYGQAQDGRAIFGTDLSFADVLILMFEMSDFLDREGYPI